MPQPLFRIVIDTNTLLSGLVSPSSSAAVILRAAERRRFVALLSKPLIDEYRAVLLDDQITARFPQITPRLVDVTIRRLRFIGDYLRLPPVRFAYPRDERDEMLLELAIALRATHILSSDKDLLSLPASRSDAGKRFRQRLHGVRVMPAGAFLRQHEPELNG